VINTDEAQIKKASVSKKLQKKRKTCLLEIPEAGFFMCFISFAFNLYD